MKVTAPHCKGRPAALHNLIQLAPTRVAYVSCDAETLARDLKVLCESAYTLKEVVPLDMFPQTHHVECVAVLELAARENALSQKSIHELQDLVRQITRNEKISESRELAREIQRHLHGQLRKSSRRIINRGVKRAPFVVLIGGTMPSVLTEIAFLSNRTDEKILKSAAGRQKVAEGLYAGLSQYMENLNSIAMLPNGQKSAANPK